MRATDTTLADDHRRLNTLLEAASVPFPPFAPAPSEHSFMLRYHQFNGFNAAAYAFKH
jgi:hypothetical protein